MKSHAYEKITMYDILQLFTKAYLRVANPSNAIKGFEVCGICPVNRNVFSKDNFYSTSNETVNSSIICLSQKNASISRSFPQPNFSMSQRNCSTPQPSCLKDVYRSHRPLSTHRWFWKCKWIIFLWNNPEGPQTKSQKKRRSEVLTWMLLNIRNCWNEKKNEKMKRRKWKQYRRAKWETLR